MRNDESSLVRTSGRRIGKGEEASNSKAPYFLRIPMCRGGGCVVNVLSLTRGRPVEVSDMITTILIRLKEPRGDNRPLGVADEPVVIVKRLTDDAHGDMSRRENKTKVQHKPALKGKAVVKVKGGTCNKASNQNHETQGELEKEGVHRGRLHPTREGVRDVYILQSNLEEASRSEIPSPLNQSISPVMMCRKEGMQWSNNTAT